MDSTSFIQEDPAEGQKRTFLIRYQQVFDKESVRFFTTFLSGYPSVSLILQSRNFRTRCHQCQTTSSDVHGPYDTVSSVTLTPSRILSESFCLREFLSIWFEQFVTDQMVSDDLTKNVSAPVFLKHSDYHKVGDFFVCSLEQIKRDLRGIHKQGCRD